MHGESRNNNPPVYHKDPPFYLPFFVVPNCTEFCRQAKYLGTSAKARDHSRCIAGTQLLFQTDSFAHLLFQDLKKTPILSPQLVDRPRQIKTLRRCRCTGWPRDERWYPTENKHGLGVIAAETWGISSTNSDTKW